MRTFSVVGFAFQDQEESIEMGSNDCSAFLVEGRLGKQRLEEEEKKLAAN